MRRIASAAFFFFGFVVLFSGAVRLQSVQSRRMRADRTAFKQWLYLPQSRYVQFTSIGYNHIVADFLWLRVIQTFGQWYAKKEDIPMLMPYFDVITDLDPKFLAVYSFGNMVIGEEAGDHENGLRLLDKGIEKNPNSYRPAYEGAFFAYWTMNKPELAKYYVRRAMKAADCPSFVRGWIGYFDLKMGRFHAGYENLFRDYIEYYNQGNADLLMVRFNGLRRSIRDWHKAEIRAKALERHRPGAALPYPSVPELEAERVFAEVEWPDWGRALQALQAAESAGEPLPQDYDQQTKFIRGFLRKGWMKVPANPISANPHFPGYMIWPGQAATEPKPGGKPGETQENKFFCLSELEVAKIVVDHVNLMGAAIAYQAKKEGKVCLTAEEVEEKMLKDLRKAQAEPWGGDWLFDPLNCSIYASTHPDLGRLYNLAPNL